MYFLRHVPFAAALAFMPVTAFAEDLVFTFNNESSYVVVELYASPGDVGEWEDDILGGEMLGSGESASVTIADGRDTCEYDLRIVFDDGDVIEDSADLCETESYTVHD